MKNKPPFAIKPDKAPTTTENKSKKSFIIGCLILVLLSVVGFGLGYYVGK